MLMNIHVYIQDMKQIDFFFLKYSIRDIIPKVFLVLCKTKPQFINERLSTTYIEVILGISWRDLNLTLFLNGISIFRGLFDAEI